MNRRLLPPVLAASLLLSALASAGCFRNAPSAPTGTEMDGPPPGPPVTGPRTGEIGGPPAGPGVTTGAPNPNLTAPIGPTVAGGVFNKHFPKDGDGFNVVFTQEKKGFAMADVMKGGKKLAQLSVNDLTANPEAINKYRTSTQQIGGYPAAPVGSNGTAILIANRYQVQVRSTDASFTAADRQNWLTKFNLSGLAQVK
jgi:hypothetical protein